MPHFLNVNISVMWGYFLPFYVYLIASDIINIHFSVYLDSKWKLQFTMADLAQPGFSDQLTVWVVIGHSTRNAHPTCGRTFSPLCGLWETAIFQ